MKSKYKFRIGSQEPSLASQLSRRVEAQEMPGGSPQFRYLTRKILFSAFPKLSWSRMATSAGAILILILMVGLSSTDARAATAKLVGKAEKLSAPPGVRKAKVTLTNKGPDPLGCYEHCAGEPFPMDDPFQWDNAEEDFASFSLNVSHQKKGTNMTEAYPARVTSSKSCFEGRAKLQLKTSWRWYCYVGMGSGTWLGVGKSFSMTVSFPASGKAWMSDNLGAAFEGRYGGGLSIDSLSSQVGIRWENLCDLTANPTQKASSGRLVVTVKAIDVGCNAKVIAAKAKIGKAVYSFGKKLPSKKLKVGQSWRVSIPFGKTGTGQIRKAVGKKIKVTGKAEFKIDGVKRSIEVEFR